MWESLAPGAQRPAGRKHWVRVCPITVALAVTRLLVISAYSSSLSLPLRSRDWLWLRYTCRSLQRKLRSGLGVAAAPDTRSAGRSGCRSSERSQGGGGEETGGPAVGTRKWQSTYSICKFTLFMGYKFYGFVFIILVFLHWYEEAKRIYGGKANICGTHKLSY